MQKITLIFLCFLCFSACKSTKSSQSASKKKPRTATVSKRNTSNTSEVAKINNVINYAKTFDGVKYKYGGTTKKGMDCSGLVMTAFKSENVLLPRTTGSLATTGDWVDIKEVQKGDLLFFATQKNSRNVNHVGLVTHTRSGYVEFIHSTTSRGVITSELSERYWYFAFVQARRIL